MLLNNIEPDIDIFSNLLCACISDKKEGFKNALKVIKMIIKNKGIDKKAPKNHTM